MGSTRRNRAWLTLAAVALAAAATVAVAMAWHADSSPTQAESTAAAPGQPRSSGRSTDELIARYEEQVRSAPTDAESRARLAAAYYQKAHERDDAAYVAKAEAVLKEALRRDPRNADALLVSGILANSLHHFRDGLVWGRRAREVAPDKPAVYAVLADAQTELGMYGAACETLQRMLDMRPDVASYSRVSYARELHGDPPGAISMMRQALASAGTAADAAWTRVMLAHLYFSQGDLRNAEREYRAALGTSPRYAQALAGLARVLAARGRQTEARSLYGKAVAQLPLPEFAQGLGELEQAGGDMAAARRHYAFARALLQKDARGGEDVAMERALFEADHGNDPSGNLARARAAYERRPSIYAADALAWCLYRTGAFGEARSYSRLALRLGTRDAILHFHAGMIAAASHERARAASELRRALAINPYFSLLQAPLARRTLARLGG